MSHYSDAEDTLRGSLGAQTLEQATYLLKSAHVHAMLAVADAIGHVADLAADPVTP